MWVRSQNKSALVNVNDISFYKVRDDSRILYEFRYYGNTDDYYVLGEYSTEEKAMKVMDMIQKYIVLGSLKYPNDNDIQWLKSYVFQMPKDEEVESCTRS